jgi:integrase
LRKSEEYRLIIDERDNLHASGHYPTYRAVALCLCFNGVDNGRVAAQMGHTDWTVMARVYYRWITKDAGDAGDKVVKKWAID